MNFNNLLTNAGALRL